MKTIILLCILLAGSSAFAQTRSVSFIHGLNSDASVWVNASSELRQKYRISTRLPNYASSQSITGIASSQVLPQIPRNSILVGHSMGGLIAREIANTQPGYADGIVTVGTPHQGSNLAKNIERVPRFTAETVGDLVKPGNIFEIGRHEDLDKFIAVAVPLLERGLARYLESAMQARSAPTVNLVPNSPYLTRLNGSSESVIANRTYAIYTTEDPFALLRLAESSDTGRADKDIEEKIFIAAASYSIGSLIARVIGHYMASRAYAALDGCPRGAIRCDLGSFPSIRIGGTAPIYSDYMYFLGERDTFYSLAQDFARAADVLYDLDRRWRDQILEAEPDGNCVRHSRRFPLMVSEMYGDGIVPCRSQYAVPGLSSEYQLRGDRPKDTGANHIEQPTHPGVIDRIGLALERLGVSRRDSGGGGGTVIIPPEF